MEKQDLLSSSLFSRIVGIMRYAIVIDKASLTNAAYILDLPGCVATGATPEETETKSSDGRPLNCTWKAFKPMGNLSPTAR